MPANRSALTDDFSLLDAMMEGSRNAPGHYRPGPYWLSKSRAAYREIKKYSIGDFRGFGNNIGASYSDGAYIDVRGHYNYGMRRPLSFLSRNMLPFSRIFNAQVRLTKNRYLEAVRYKNIIANESAEIRNLIGKYKIPQDSIRGGCMDYSTVDGKKFANHYLELLKTHDILTRNVDFSSIRSFFEIGGGFGVNTHLLIENYENIRKVVYLDIPPNLYVGTQYLKSFFGDKVRTYADTKDLEKIQFSPTDELEIICIAPQQIEQLDVDVDLFQNSHSFVEMTKDIIKNYAKHIERLMHKDNSTVALVTYQVAEGFDKIDHNELTGFFPRDFLMQEEQALWAPETRNHYFVSAPSKPAP